MSAASDGAITDDTPFILRVQKAAQAVAALFEAELLRGETTVAELFDSDYQRVVGSNLPQFLTRFVALTDRLLLAVLEEVLASDPRIVACIAVDRNGYCATHNRVTSHRQGPDLIWNIANCRQRCMFDDRNGARAARDDGAFLLQSYRRIMGAAASPSYKT